MPIGAEKRVMIRKGVDKAFRGFSNDKQKGGWNTTISAGVVCRSLELMSALGMMEDHNRLLPATESKSGLVNVAMRNRGVLVLTCFLVALGSLLCVGKESLAKQPDPAPKSDPYATSNRPMNSRPADAGPPAPATRPDPAPRGPVDRGPVSRPARQRPVERAAPAGRRAPDFRQPAERAGTQVDPPEK